MMIKSIILEPVCWFTHFLIWMPGNCGDRLRYLLYRKYFKECGRDIHIPPGCFFRGLKNIILKNDILFGPWCQIYASGNNEEQIIIGEGVCFNSNVMVNAELGGKIKIGNKVLIGPNVVLRASNHSFSRRDRPICEQGHAAGVIVIEDDVWIGSNVTILPNVTIGRGAVVGAGAVVNKSIEAYSIVGGVPAKQIGTRGG